MRLYNKSSLPNEEVWKLARFATRGVQDNEVLVEVTDTEKHFWTGVAWSIGTNQPAFYNSSLPRKYVDRYWANGKNSQYLYFVLIRVPAEPFRTRDWKFDQQWMMRKYRSAELMKTYKQASSLLPASTRSARSRSGLTSSPQALSVELTVTTLARFLAALTSRSST